MLPRDAFRYGDNSVSKAVCNVVSGVAARSQHGWCSTIPGCGMSFPLSRSYSF